MKKLMIPIILLHICIVLNAQHSYTLNYDLSDFSFVSNHNVLTIGTSKDAPYYLEDQSAPALPYFACRILRPSNMSSNNYTIKYKKVLLRENVDIEKNPLICSTDTTYKNNSDSIVTATRSSYAPVLFGSDNKRYGYSYGFFRVSPFLYDYNSKSLYFISELTITFPETGEKEVSTTVQREKAEDIRRWVINPSDLNTFYPVNESETKATLWAEKTIYNGYLDYLIITNEALKQTFQTLLDWKIRKGLRATIVTTEIIDAMYTDPTYSLQKKIKAYISLCHNLNHLKWVLLGGDGSIIPIQYCEAKVNLMTGLNTTSTPCDLYYSCLYNLDWDTNGNGISGEFADNVNLEQNVYVTRAPVDNSTKASNFIQKVIKYEQCSMNNSYLTKMLFAGARAYGYAGSVSDAHYQSEKLYNDYISSNWSYGHHYLYDTGSNISGYSQLTATNLSTLINTGYHFIHNYSHGESSFWDHNLIDTYNITKAENQTNTTPTIIVTSSCFTNAFDSLCLSKAFINSAYGAVAYYGSSRNALTYSSNPYSFVLSILYNAYFFSNLLNGYPTDSPYSYGAVAAESKTQLMDYANYSETDGYRFLQFAINPLGDPEMPIYTSSPSVFSNVSVNINDGNQVTVSTGGVSGCKIALVSTDNGLSYFDVVDNVSSYIFTDVVAPCYVTITKHNYKPYHSNTIVYPNFSIQGTGNLCGDNVYSISNLPSGCTVEWSFANSASPVSALLHQNVPSQGKCTISNPNQLHINETLKAVIKYNNAVYGNAYMHVSTAGDFSASFTQTGGTLNGITYPTITNTIYDNGHQGAFELRTMSLTSTDFSNCNFTFTGFTPSQWYVSGNTLYIIFPSVGGSTQQCLITGKKTNECKVFQFYIHVLPSSSLSNLIQTDFLISSQGRRCTVSIENSECPLAIEGIQGNVRMDIPEIWNLLVTNAKSGSVVYKESVHGKYAVFETTGWKPGVYIITCEIAGNTTSKKFVVK